MIIDNNPDCFSKKGDATTLKVGSKLLIGYDYDETKENTEDGKKETEKSGNIVTAQDNTKTSQHTTKI